MSACISNWMANRRQSRSRSAELVMSLPDLARDLVEVAALVYAVDSAVTRGGLTDRMMGRDWNRAFRIEMPVRMIRAWNAPGVREALEETLMFLSGDRFAFEIVEHASQPLETGFLSFGTEEGWRVDRVMMFSGGLDSFAGALEQITSSMAAGSHWSVIRRRRRSRRSKRIWSRKPWRSWGARSAGISR